MDTVQQDNISEGTRVTLRVQSIEGNENLSREGARRRRLTKACRMAMMVIPARMMNMTINNEDSDDCDDDDDEDGGDETMRMVL